MAGIAMCSKQYTAALQLDGARGGTAEGERRPKAGAGQAAEFMTYLSLEGARAEITERQLQLLGEAILIDLERDAGIGELVAADAMVTTVDAVVGVVTFLQQRAEMQLRPVSADRVRTPATYDVAGEKKCRDNDDRCTFLRLHLIAEIAAIKGVR